jgi:DNA repair exonuclease SbcCD ATPase subunit
MTLIVGKNGHGKTTFGEALCYGLFGRSWRGIKKPALVNSINNRDMLVEVDFDVQGRNYIIRRGMKPTILEIYCEGELVNQSSSIKDYQAWIETNVLHLNFRSFTQVVMLGTGGFVPFMLLPAAARREVIEDLLDLRIFSTMNSVLKERIQMNREDLGFLEMGMAASAENKKLKIDHLNKLINQSKRHQKQIDDRRVDILQHLSTQQEKRKRLSEAHEKAIAKTSEYGGITQDIAGIESNLKNYERSRWNIKKEITFLEKNDTCSTCSQPITPEFRSKMMVDVEHRLTLLDIAGRQDMEKLQDLKEKQAKATLISNKASEIRSQLYAVDMDIANQEKALSDLDAWQSVDHDIDDLKSQILAADEHEKVRWEQRIKLQEERDLLETVGVLLKDTGIKKQILDTYIPVINATVNKYLNDMEFFVSFEIDSNFNETLRARHYDEFSYANFSQGEKMRIDLALLLAWRHVAQMKNSVNTNILLFDEILDASLDSEGCEILLGILRSLSASTSIFVISHKGDSLVEKFDRTLEARKTKGFTSIQELA